MNNYLFLILFFTAHFLYSQTSNPLANFGGKRITTEEFRFRYELSPKAGGSADYITQKEQFLYTLISEKLWALEADNIGLGNDEYLNNYLTIIKKMYLRDALFKDEIENKIIITGDEINKELGKIDWELEIKFLFSPNKNEIDSLYQKLQSGIKFDSLLDSRPEKIEQKEKIKVVYGQVEQEKENLLFSLETGKYSKPVPEKIGWVIYYLKSRNPSPLSSGMDFEKKNQSVKEVIENRKKKLLFESFIKYIFGDRSINVDKDLHKKLLDALIKVSGKKCERLDCAKDEKLILYESDFYSIKNYFTKDELKANYVKFDNNPIDLNYFIDNLAFNEFVLNSVSDDKIERTLSGYTREFITLELVVREAEKRNYRINEETQNEINLWRENYLSQLLRNAYIDSARITDDEALKYYLETKNDSTPLPTIKIIELLTDDLHVVEEVINNISEGADFKLLANKYSQRLTENGSNILVLDFSNRYPELKEAASKLNIGDFGGPIKLETGYSIFQVVEKDTVGNKLSDSFEAEKENIKQKLFYTKMDNLIKKKTVNLAKKYNLEVNEDLLGQVNTTKINALIYRHFGFGGRILAAPFLNMFYEWYDEYLKEISEPL